MGGTDATALLRDGPDAEPPRFRDREGAHRVRVRPTLSHDTPPAVGGSVSGRPAASRARQNGQVQPSRWCQPHSGATSGFRADHLPSSVIQKWMPSKQCSYSPSQAHARRSVASTSSRAYGPVTSPLTHPLLLRSYSRLRKPSRVRRGAHAASGGAASGLRELLASHPRLRLAHTGRRPGSSRHQARHRRRHPLEERLPRSGARS